jgi:guanosine-3',5'-bis(diphosphate) 3'-pyrophosphohydrolase
MFSKYEFPSKTKLRNNKGLKFDRFILMNETLEKVYEFAKQAHGAQRRKFVDEEYINHPVRVMETCQQYSDSIPVAAAALLHDVLEDTKVTAEEMTDFLKSIMPNPDALKTMLLVRDLTDVYTHGAYPNWNRRIRKNKETERLAKAHPDAQTIKYADIIDNASSIAESGDDFAFKFLNECKFLLKKMTAGNKDLHEKAIEAVNAGSALRPK